MALFGRKKEANTKDTDTAKQTSAPAVAPRPQKRSLENVLLAPHITEKAVAKQSEHVYVFTVRRDATKRDIAEAVEEKFGVTPEKIRIVNRAPRQYLSRRLGRRVTEKGMKKAYVYLKAGDTISIM